MRNRGRSVTGAPWGCAAAAVVVAVLVPSRASAVGEFKIHLYLGDDLAANPEAVAAFRRAAGEWEAFIANPIRVNIEADLGTFDDPRIIGATGFGTEPVNLDYSMVRAKMAARAGRPGNAVLAYLPTRAELHASVPDLPGASFDPTTIGILRANQKALGLIDGPLTDPLTDGQITFNSAFQFDYDRGDGIDPDKMDFQTVAAHEIGHVLGFISDTDDYDRFGGIPDNATTLDLFRFTTAARPATFDEFRTFARELRPGVEAVTTDLVNEYHMSTGANLGDGNQASHWKDDVLVVGDTTFLGPLIGIMDPTLPFGTSREISEADLRAMELIGYDTPEPGSGMLLVAGAGFGALGRRGRRRGPAR